MAEQESSFTKTDISPRPCNVVLSKINMNKEEENKLVKEIEASKTIGSKSGTPLRESSVVLKKLNMEKDENNNLIKEIGDILNSSITHEFNSNENNNYIKAHKMRRSNKMKEDEMQDTDPISISFDNSESHDLRKHGQINYNVSDNEQSLNESLLDCSNIDEESIDSGSYLDNSFCAICKGYDDPELCEEEADAKTEWIGCECDRWYHSSCLSNVATNVGLQLNHENFNCEQINNECIQ